jgi:hypothetical protein
MEDHQQRHGRVHQIIEVSGDLLLHIIEGLEGSGGFDSVLGGGRRAVKSQVLVESIS